MWNHCEIFRITSLFVTLINSNFYDYELSIYMAVFWVVAP
jgi:hypothetical protein